MRNLWEAKRKSRAFSFNPVCYWCRYSFNVNKFVLVATWFWSKKNARQQPTHLPWLITVSNFRLALPSLYEVEYKHKNLHFILHAQRSFWSWYENLLIGSFIISIDFSEQIWTSWIQSDPNYTFDLTFFDCTKEAFPEESKFDDFELFIITGSPADSYKGFFYFKNHKPISLKN